MSDTQPPKANQVNHDRRGAFAEGNTAQQAKVEHRVRRRAGMASHLRRETRDGIELAEIMLRIARDFDHPAQFKAAEWCEARAVGALPKKVQLSGPKGKPLAPFASADLPALLELAKAKGGG